MGERSLSMREVPGSIPGFSSITFVFTRKPINTNKFCNINWELAQMVERSTYNREVPGSIPGFSSTTFFFTLQN